MVICAFTVLVDRGNALSWSRTFWTAICYVTRIILKVTIKDDKFSSIKVIKAVAFIPKWFFLKHKRHIILIIIKDSWNCLSFWFSARFVFFKISTIFPAIFSLLPLNKGQRCIYYAYKHQNAENCYPWEIVTPKLTQSLHHWWVSWKWVSKRHRSIIWVKTHVHNSGVDSLATS
jgi:hypothetical protein